MLNYKFQDSLDRINWASASFNPSPKASDYQNGVPPTSLGIDLKSQTGLHPSVNAAESPDTPTQPITKQKKGAKLILWIALILLLIGLGFGLYKLKG